MKQFIDAGPESPPPLIPAKHSDCAVFPATAANIKDLPEFVRKAHRAGTPHVHVQFSRQWHMERGSTSVRYAKDLTELMLTAAQRAAHESSPSVRLTAGRRPYPSTHTHEALPMSKPLYYTNIEGWFNFENVYAGAILQARDGDVMVEVGAWLGKSTCFMAEMLRDMGRKVKFYAVDTWTGEDGDADQMSAVADSHDGLYSQFEQNMKAAGVEDYVLPVIGKSVDVASTFEDQSIDFLFLDGDHTEAAAQADLEAWYPKLRAGGVIAGHDYDKPSVARAVDNFFHKYGRRVERVAPMSWGHCWQVGVAGQCRLPGKASPDYGRIFDCFTFYDELDILELRLRELEDVVDVFVICECPFDFRGHPKPLTFLENQDRFARWLPSIRHVTAQHPPLQTPDESSNEVWDNEGYQRNALGLALDDCDPGDLIMVSDVDEIPSADAVRRVPRDGNITRLKLDVFHYNFNWLDVNNTWYVQDVRAVSYAGFTLANDLRCSQECYSHDHAGWHLTWFGGKEKVAQKVTWYSHPLLGTENASTSGAKQPLVLVQGKPLSYVSSVSTLPKFIRENLPRFKHFFDPLFVDGNEKIFP